MHTHLKAAVSAEMALTTKETCGSCWNLSSISLTGIWRHGVR